MKSFYLALALLLGCALPALSQNVRVDGVVQSAHGPAPNVFVAACSQPANLSVTPCTTRVPLCSSLTDVVCTSPNPVNSDGLGNYFFYLPAGGTYTYQFYGTGLQTRSFVDQQPGSAAAAGSVLLAPLGDQTILGSHQLINRGTEQVGNPFASFDSDVQGFSIDPASGNVGISGQLLKNNSTGVQGISSGTSTGGNSNAGVTGLGEGLNGTSYGGFFANFSNVTAGNNYFGVGVEGQISVGPTIPVNQTAIAVAGEALNFGPSSVTGLASFSTAGNGVSGGGTATKSYGYDVSQAMSVGTPASNNAAFHAADQGSGANNYGILLDGVTHNDLGGGVTKVGSLLGSGLGATLPTCTDGSKTLVTGCTTPFANLFASPPALGSVAPNTGAFTSLGLSAQFTSTLGVGTTPFLVTSTTPVANLTTVPTTYNHSGTQSTGVHLIEDRCTLGTDCSVTLTGSAVYTSSSSYDCMAVDRTAANAVKFAPSSGSAFALTGTGTDLISYVCTGN